MPSEASQSGEEGRLDLTERQRERFEEIKAEWSDGHIPEPSDEHVLDGLLDTKDAAADGYYSGSAGVESGGFDAAREALLKCSLPGVDVADLIDYVEVLEANGYRGDVRIQPDARREDVVFEAGIAAGYACGLKDGESE